MKRQKVLVVDDEPTIRHALTRMLKVLDVDVTTAADGEEALQRFGAVHPDIVLLDINMPRVDGFEVCERLKGSPDSMLTPVIIVTSSNDRETRVRGIDAGADDFLTKPFDRVELAARVRSLLRLKRYTDELDRAESVLFALARAIEGKDPYTKGHCERLALYGEKLGRRIGLAEEQVVALRRGGIVHDIGKVAVPDRILLKAGPLSEEERSIMCEHVVVGEQICSGLQSFLWVLPIIRHHHERMDGSGYPDGLRGEEIPRTARVLQIVDIFDALTTCRPYKPALTPAKAFEIMEEEAARGWRDRALLREFEKLVEEEGFLESDFEPDSHLDAVGTATIG